jgi:putative ABC transport system substrate-binding protein
LQGSPGPERKYLFAPQQIRQLGDIGGDAPGFPHGPAAWRRRVRLAARYAVPTIYPAREFTESGGLTSYGPNLLRDIIQQAGIYVGRILKGTKPADLPVQQSIKLELVINLKIAKAAPPPRGFYQKGFIQ